MRGSFADISLRCLSRIGRNERDAASHMRREQEAKRERVANLGRREPEKTRPRAREQPEI